MAAERSELTIRTAQIVNADRTKALSATRAASLAKPLGILERAHLQFAERRSRAIKYLLITWDQKP